MQTFHLTFLYPIDGSDKRSQSKPQQFEAESFEAAKRVADGLIERENRTHRTIDVAVLARIDDDLTEITRWVRKSGWMDA
ncbi:hypothetical protein J7I84_18590 [Arthrobacter sp. ISL-85]|uniref:hypothetical protein n=1 Tax=Arthrobacter sp. ISL-85 TaxID=2819115 RepID=UPI001BE63494|nr:hypothetical protein [Arthrobacter sp. ISL-85]MBT2568465.1 hypothetical protein [Arthrobacter sp. ISL-85]